MELTLSPACTGWTGAGGGRRARRTWRHGAWADPSVHMPLASGVVKIKNGAGAWELEIKYADWGRYLLIDVAERRRPSAGVAVPSTDGSPASRAGVRPPRSRPAPHGSSVR